MKILRLQFKNLNSLYGEWEIDFTNHSFQQDGLFVLSGPTGAGKSTILDAICLALYGQTPRLGKITQSGNEIMSKHTANCYSLLHFETKGTQYYARFEQKKARNNPKGKLQDVERSIAKDSPDNIICRKKTDINDEIIQITGMDFSRFTRSILLAQGAFDSFLKARDEEKSMLLEQITGTEIYSEISIAVFERAKLEKDKTRELTVLTENSQILSPEEIENLQKTQKEHDQTILTINNALNQIETYIIWFNKIAELETKYNQEQKNYAELLEKQKNSHEKKNALLKAEKAEKLVPAYTLLSEQKKELQGLITALKEKERAFPEQKNMLQTLSNTLEQMQLTHQEYRACYEKNVPLFDEIKKLDILLEAKNKNITTQQEQIQKEEKEKSEIDTQVTQLSTDKKNISENLAKLTAWLQNNHSIESLKQELSAIKQRTEQLKITAAHKEQTEKKIQAQQKELTSQNTHKNTLEKKQQELLAEIMDSKNKLDKIANNLNIILDNSKIEDLQAQLSLLREKKILLEKIASLEEQRKNLQEGQPCPLCGSTTHPYITEHDTLPAQSNIDIEIKQLEKRIKEIEQLQYQQEKMGDNIFNKENQLAELTQNFEQFSKLIQEKEQAIKELQAEKDTIQAAYEKQKQELEQQVVAFKIPELDPQHAEEIFAQLQEKCTLWDKRNTQKQEIETNLQNKTIQLTNTKTKQELYQKNIKEKNQQLKREQEEFNSIQATRKERFGTKNPFEEEKNLQEQIKLLERKQENYRQQKDQQTQELTKLEEQISQLKSRIEEESKQVSENKEQFLQKITEQGFLSLEEFSNSILGSDTITALQDFFRTLEQNLAIAKKQADDTTQKLQEEKNKNLTQKSKQELEAQKQSYKEKKDTLLQEAGNIKGKLEQNQKLIETNKENKRKLEKQKKEQDKWELLNLLIGSSDGKKFRTIAQAVTFEHVIHYANAKLQLLQQRYLLIQNEQNPLSLNVLDNYQGGEIRAIQNLSGGETFIVSLSLALGLAQMASQNVQVDSLFLDEGFGTLDEENLDTALSTLASIQQEGKLIGVISHIPLLKERITTQIDIIPNHNGKSIIEGAGCKRLA